MTLPWRALLAIGALAGCKNTEPVAATSHEGDRGREASAVESAGARATSAAGASAVDEARQPTPEPLPPCSDPYFAFKLKGQTQAHVLGRFGPPAERESYRAVERGGEFYGAIEHEYPSTKPENRDVPIEEWTWTSGECILTVWFHRPRGTPIVLYDIYWHQDTAF